MADDVGALMVEVVVNESGRGRIYEMGDLWLSWSSQGVAACLYVELPSVEEVLYTRALADEGGYCLGGEIVVEYDHVGEGLLPSHSNYWFEGAVGHLEMKADAVARLVVEGDSRVLYS